MVGRAGRTRSTGCLTCIRRKVKCDESRPTCVRCRDAFMICDGYRNDGIVFINEDVRSQSPGTKTRPKAKYQHRSGVQTPTSLGQDPGARFKSPVDPPPRMALADQESLALPSPFPSLDLSGFREQVRISYIAERLFPGSGYQGAPNSRSWILDSIDYDKTSVAYKTACCLGAGVFAGTHSTSPDRYREASMCYIKAVRQLNTNLEDPKTRKDPANIVASLLLGIYELSVSTNGYGWICHAGGVGRLIKALGPEPHQGGLGKRYFMLSRLSITSQALHTRQRTFLEQEKWRPNSSQDAEWSESQKCNAEIFNIFARIPGVLEDSDRSTESPGPSSLPRLHNTIIQILANLFVWRWNWDRVHPNMAYTITVDTQNSLSADYPGPLFETRIGMHEFHIERLLILYDTALLVLLDLAQRLYIPDAPYFALQTLRFHPRPSAKNALILPHEYLSIREVTQEILRSIEFHLEGEHAMVGAMMLLLPIRTVVTFVDDERERRWLRSILERIAGEHGWRLGGGELGSYANAGSGLRRAIEERRKDV